MAPNLLVLGGTTEATALCQALSDRGINGRVSFAGRVERPRRQPLPQISGGFGGPDGLASYIESENITHVIDATHPFAAQMSRNAILACERADIPLVALTRAPWVAEESDDWRHVADIAGAVQALDQPRRNVMLAVGRMHLSDFAPNPQHFYLLRLVDPPTSDLPLPDHKVIVDRGPFRLESDLKLMRENAIDLVVSKNAGGTGASAKIIAARELGLPVIMIDRPEIPQRREFHDVPDVLDWIEGHD